MTNANTEDHFHQLDHPDRRIRIYHEGTLLADSGDTILLKEVYGDHLLDPAYYLPKEDVKMELASENSHATSCPIKGEATYWDFSVDEKNLQKLAWSYEDPVEYSNAIQGMISFDTDRVTLEISPVR